MPISADSGHTLRPIMWRSVKASSQPLLFGALPRLCIPRLGPCTVWESRESAVCNGVRASTVGSEISRGHCVLRLRIVCRFVQIVNYTATCSKKWMFQTWLGALFTQSTVFRTIQVLLFFSLSFSLSVQSVQRCPVLWSVERRWRNICKSVLRSTCVAMWPAMSPTTLQVLVCIFFLNIQWIWLSDGAQRGSSLNTIHRAIYHTTWMLFNLKSMYPFECYIHMSGHTHRRHQRECPSGHRWMPHIVRVCT